jgi:glycogen(starch) synthase
VHPTDLGPELHGESWVGKIFGLVRTTLAVPSFIRLVRLIRSHDIRIVHTSDRPRDALAAILLARVTRAQAIIHVHVGVGDWMSPLLRWSLRQADALVAISDFVAGTLISNGHDPARIRVVLNGIDATSWTPCEGRAATRDEFHLPPRAPLLVTVCRLFPSKGPGELIRVVPSLLEEYPDLQLLIVGKEMVPGFQAELEDLVRQLNVLGHVTFTGHRSDIAHIMAGADIFAMPSVGEPFGLVYLEAMAMKLPVVALRSGGTPEVVLDEVTGLLSEPDDLEGLRRHLSDLLGAPQRREAMGACGRLRVERSFSTVRMARDAAAVYKWLLARSPR